MDNAPSALISEIFLDAIRHVIREELKAAAAASELLTPDQLATKLNVPVSWVYEQSRQGNIPTHRLGRYIRFDLREVIASQPCKAT